MGTHSKYDILALWRQGSTQELEGTPEQQGLAAQLRAVGYATILSSIKTVYAAHSFHTNPLAEGLPKGDPRKSAVDEVSILQMKLHPRYQLLRVPYPPGASNKTLGDMQTGLRAGAQVLEEIRNDLAGTGLDLPGAGDLGASHFTGELYVPSNRVPLGQMWAIPELEALANAAPQPLAPLPMRSHPPAAEQT